VKHAPVRAHIFCARTIAAAALEDSFPDRRGKAEDLQTVAGLPATLIGREIMRDYGELSIHGDYVGDLDKIAEVLNGYEFDQGEDREERFHAFDECIETNRSHFDGVTAAFPVFRWWYSPKDGRRLPQKTLRELPDIDYDEWELGDFEEVSLAELSNAIAPLLKRGTLELVSIIDSEPEGRQEILEIRSDGWVQRHRHDWATFQPEHARESCNAEEDEDALFNVDLAIKPTESATISDDQSDDGSTALTPLDPNGRNVSEDRAMPDNETTAPKTREEYVAEFKKYYDTSIAARHNRGFVGIFAPSTMDARKEIEMYRVTYEAQRSLDYWEFAEFWKEIGLKRGAICKVVHIGKLYPSILRHMEKVWPNVGLMIQLPYDEWFRSEFRRQCEEWCQNVELESGEQAQAFAS
jgi:hypothetical protein